MKTIALFFISIAVSQASVPVRTQLMAQKSRDFSRWIQVLAESNDPSTLNELKLLAKDRTLPEDRRYMAIMGVSRKSTHQSLPWLLTLLEDPSFHVRSASLTSIAALSRLSSANERGQSKILQNALSMSLRDSALWIRIHALNLVQEFNFRSVKTDVEYVLKDSRNHVQGKPLAIVSQAQNVLNNWN